MKLNLILKFIIKVILQWIGREHLHLKQRKKKYCLYRTTCIQVKWWRDTTRRYLKYYLFQNKIKELNYKEIKEAAEKFSEIDEKSSFYYKSIQELDKKLVNKKEELQNLQEKELSRISKEYLVNDYMRRFKIDQQTLIAAIVGQDYAAREYINKLREQRVIFKK